MRTLSDTMLRRRSIYLVLFVVIACDSFNGDFPKPENQVTFAQTEFFILPGTSTVVDLRSVIKQSFVSASLTISQNPTKGTLTQMDAFVLKYTPTVDFSDGQDQFVFSAVLDDGTTVKSEIMTIHMIFSEKEFPCGVYPVEDNIRMKSISPVVVHVKKNDRICGVIGPVNISIHLKPTFGEADVVGDSIVYTPGPAFSDGDELVYSLSTSTGDIDAFGLVSFNKKSIEVFNIPAGYNDIFFVDDMTGFIAGDTKILKTIDGGKHWNPLAYPAGERDLLDFQEIHFLDKETGFAAYSMCEWPGEDPSQSICWGGWMVTGNGGSTWKRINLGRSVSSISFTSSQTGYISSSVPNFLGPAGVRHTILKTVDGGVTWDEIFTTTGDFGELMIRFTDDLVGFAYDKTAIYKTADGGQTWEPSVDNEVISSFAIVDDDVVCASFSSNNDFATTRTPGAIVRSENGSVWNPVSDFPQTILSLGFSPDGELGLAGRLTNYDPDNYVMTLSKSSDKGKTWVDLEQQVYGYPLQISVPSPNVAYILCTDKLIKYSLH